MNNNYWIRVFGVFVFAFFSHITIAKPPGTKVIKYIDPPSYTWRRTIAHTTPIKSIRDLDNTLYKSTTRNNINRLKAYEPSPQTINLRTPRLRNLPDISNDLSKSAPTPIRTKARFQRTWDRYSVSNNSKVKVRSGIDIKSNKNVDDLRRFNSRKLQDRHVGLRDPPTLPNDARLTEKRFDHIVERHWYSSKTKNTGKFLEGTTRKKLNDMIQTTVNKGSIRPNTPGRSGSRKGTIAEYAFDDVIGINAKGNLTKQLRVVRDEIGNVRTAFPY